MPEPTFFFYDLETTGLNVRRDRIMQFAGQRTGLDLQPIGQPINVLVKLTDDVLPSPQAILVTGKTPQLTQEKGISEVELARMLQEQIFSPGTIAVGFNTIRFDDEFIRNLFWRTFHDPYTWAWSDGRSRWDMLDVVRMTRALRPGDIVWPVDEEGLPVNKLEVLAEANGLVHDQAHDAMSDVEATMGMARLIRSKQPKLFEYLFTMRDKRAVSELINLDNPQPFVYVSGRFGRVRQFSTVALGVARGSNQNEVIVYDTQVSPAEFAALSPSQVHEALFSSEYDGARLPFKRLKLNACPAVAPISVLDADDGWQRLGLDKEVIEEHVSQLRSLPHLVDLVEEAFASRPEFSLEGDPDEQLYAGFVNDSDRRLMNEVVRRDGPGLVDWHPTFDDERLPGLLLHYKARYFPSSLSYHEQVNWGNYRGDRLMAQLPAFAAGLILAKNSAQDDEDLSLIAAVEDWARSILPSGALDSYTSGEVQDEF